MANHLQQIEETLREMLTHNDPEDVVKWVKGEVLKSYKNGRASAIRGATGAGRNKSARSQVTSNRGGKVAEHHGH
jgi:hypothetical protein